MVSPQASDAEPAGATGDAADGCEIQGMFQLLARAHTLDILHVFMRQGPGPFRFVDLQADLDVPANTLSDRLKRLVDAGLVTRHVDPATTPPRVTYAPTALAHRLRPAFDNLGEWVRERRAAHDGAGR